MLAMSLHRITVASGLFLSASIAGGCALFFPSGEYVGGEGTGGGAGEGGGTTSSTSSLGGQGNGGEGTGGSTPGEAVARVFVAFGDRDKPPEIPGSFETKVYEVHYADMDASGVIGPWRSALSTPLRGQFEMAYVDGALIAYGRAVDLDSFSRPVTFRAPLGDDALPVTWTPSVDSTLLTFGSRQVVLGPRGGYLLGGYSSSWPDGNGGTTTRYFENAEFNPIETSTGAMSARVEGGIMTEQKRHPGTLVHDGVLYAVGGYGSSPTYKTTVEYSVLDANGLPGAFVGLGELPGIQVSTTLPLLTPALCADETHLFVVGGTLSSGSPSDLVLSAPIQGDGSLGEFTHVTKLSTPLGATKCLVHEGRIYVFGGQGTSERSALVLVNDVLAGGQLAAAWDSTSNAPLPYARSGAAVAIVPLETTPD
jgi:hypothetical protein